MSEIDPLSNDGLDSESSESMSSSASSTPRRNKRKDVQDCLKVLRDKRNSNLESIETALAVLTQVASDDSGRLMMSSENPVVNPSLSIMEYYPEEVSIQRLGCELMATLTQTKKGSHATRIIKGAGNKTLLNAIRIHADDREVVIFAARAIRKLALADKKISMMARFDGGVQLLFQVIEQHTGDEDVLADVINVLSVFAKNENTAGIIGADGGIPLFARILSVETHVSVINPIFSCLFQLCKQQKNALIFVSENGVQLVLSVLHDFSTEMSLLKNALQVLKSLAGVIHKNSGTSSQSIPFKALFEVMENHQDEIEILKLASSILWKLQRDRFPAIPIDCIRYTPGDEMDIRSLHHYTYLDNEEDIGTIFEAENYYLKWKRARSSLADQDASLGNQDTLEQQENVVKIPTASMLTSENLDMLESTKEQVAESSNAGDNVDDEEDEFAIFQTKSRLDDDTWEGSDLDDMDSESDSVISGPENEHDSYAVATPQDQETLENLGIAHYDSFDNPVFPELDLNASYLSKHSDFLMEAEYPNNKFLGGPLEVEDEDCDGQQEILAATQGQIFVSSVREFVQPPPPCIVPEFDMDSDDIIDHREPQYEQPKSLIFRMMISDLQRIAEPDLVVNRIVYDCRDSELVGTTAQYLQPEESQDSQVEHIYTVPSSPHPNDSRHLDLEFESRYECGNLRRATKIFDNEYDLILDVDINTDHHIQWFNFQVQNMKAGTPYKFNIINLEKPNSQFNFGMKPVMLSMKEFKSNGNGWQRVGYDVCYYPNQYSRRTSVTKKKENPNSTKTTSYYTETFTIEFPHDQDTCFVAYHYPYTYSHIQKYLYNLEMAPNASSMLRRQLLTTTLTGNRVDLLTVTSMPDTSGLGDDVIQELEDAMKAKPVVVLSARVHPGETNASWVFKGLLDFLLSDDSVAKQLRDQLVFKIVPILNPDGVINGSHRCSMEGKDLNREYLATQKHVTPSVFYIKNLLRSITQEQNRYVKLYCDFHGHSRQRDSFMYGCNNDSSDNDNLRLLERVFPWMLSQSCDKFRFGGCAFAVQESKKGSARIAVRKGFDIPCAFTLECTYNGSSTSGYHFGILDLQDIGLSFGLNIWNTLDDGQVQEAFAVLRAMYPRDKDKESTGPKKKRKKIKGKKGKKKSTK